MTRAGGAREQGLLATTLIRVVPLALAVLAVIWFVAARETRDVVRSDAEAQLDRQVVHLSEVLGQRLRGMVDYVHALSRNELLIGGLFDVEQRDLYLPPYFRSLGFNGATEAVVDLADYKGNVFMSTATGRIGRSVWAADGPPAGHRGVRIGSGGLVIVDPIEYDGHVEGWIGFVQTAAGLDRLLREPREDIWIVVRDGAGRSLSASGPEGLPASADPGPGSDGWIVRSRALPGFPELTVEVARRRAEVYETSDRLSLFLVGAVAATMVALVLGIALAGWLITGPVGRIVDTIRGCEDPSLLSGRLRVGGPRELKQLADAFIQANAQLAHEIEARRQANEELSRLASRNALLAAAMEATTSGVTIADMSQPDVPVIYCNTAFLKLTGYDAEEVIGRNCRFLSGPQTDPAARASLARAVAQREPAHVEILNYRKDRSTFWNDLLIYPLLGNGQTARYIVGVQTDMSERKRMEAERERLNAERLAAHRLESLGSLAGGIAHEINTPTQYVGDNLRFLKSAFGDLLPLLEWCHAEAAADKADGALARLAAQGDLEFMRGEIPAALEQSLDGIGRIAQIVQAIKEFSHPYGKEKAPLDLNHAIQTTLTVARNHWKYVAEVKLELDPTLPPVPCLGGEIGQVLINLLVNAAQAIESEGASDKGTIAIRTSRAGDHVEIEIADTGVGIPADKLHRIFDPFFTTKAPGKGTGQGLAICHAIVVKEHGGRIDVRSEPGVGTVFTVSLPLDDGAAPDRAAA
jgi:PAS domain S-box-containing protein